MNESAKKSINGKSIIRWVDGWMGTVTVQSAI